MLKFWLIFVLARRESDVFIFRRPDWIIAALSADSSRQQQAELKGGPFDIIVSSHQYNPTEPNIGFFGCRGSKVTSKVFENTMLWTEKDKNLHDQRAFCLVTKLCQNRENRQSPVNVPLPSSMNLRIRQINAHEIAASVRPWAMPETIGIHVLSTRPLQSPFAKSYLSRELRATPATPQWLHTDPRARLHASKETKKAAGRKAPSL